MADMIRHIVEKKESKEGENKENMNVMFTSFEVQVFP
jgi:hypothetical protein